jgi:hypothetical protein
VAVLVDAAAYRLAGNAHADLPLRALRAVARRVEQGMTAEQMFTKSPDICDDVPL